MQTIKQRNVKLIFEKHRQFCLKKLNQYIYNEERRIECDEKMKRHRRVWKIRSVMLEAMEYC